MLNDDGTIKYGDGAYNYATQEIIINPEGKRTAEQLLSHELLHHMVAYMGGIKSYRQLMKTAKKKMGTNRKAGIAEEYFQSGVIDGVDNVILSEEIVAHYAEDFANQDFFNAVLNEKQGFGQRILSFLKNAIVNYDGDERLTREAKKFQKMYKKLFDQFAERNYQGNSTENAVTNIKQENVHVSDSKNRNNSNSKYAIVALDDGKVYVQASRNVIKGNTVAEMRKDIADLFDQLLEDKPSLDIHTIQGDILTITKNQTAIKARDNYKNENGNRIKMSDSEFAVKLRIEAHIDEIAEISKKDKKTKVDTKNHNIAKDGFTYRNAYFKDFDGQYYDVTISIGHNDNVATVYNVGKIKGSVSPSAKIIAVVGSKPLGKALPIKSITESEPNVNTNSKKRNALPLEKGADLEYNEYSEKQYNDFGWARANEILNEGQNKDFTTKFAEAVNGSRAFQKSKSGEFMIPVSDVYDSVFNGVNNTIVFAKGKIDEPVITRVLQIDEFEETTLDKIRRRVYEVERRGIQQKAGGVFRRYNAIDFEYGLYKQRNKQTSDRHNDRLGINRGASSSEADGVEELSQVNKRYALPSKGSKYDLDALISKKDLRVVKLHEKVPLKADDTLDRGAILVRAKINARKQNNPNNTENDTYVYVPDIELNVRVNRDGLEHGLNSRAHDTAIATMKIGDLLKNSVAVNEINGRKTSKKQTEMSYILLAVGQNKKVHILQE